MKFIDVKLSRFIAGPAAEVFDVWFDPESPGGPWHGAKKVMMNRCPARPSEGGRRVVQS